MQDSIFNYLIAKGFAAKKAQSLVMTGKVFVNNEKITTIGFKVKPIDNIEVHDDEKDYVSRGAYKLLAAIDKFGLDFDNRVVLDIGASTGGFTQVALKSGAKVVYALDSGTNQLDYSLRINPRVVSLEKTNLKTITKNMFAEAIEIVVCDVSFISLKNVFNVLKDFDVVIMALIKPQFEANSNQVEKGGFVPETIHEEIIEKVKGYALQNGFILENIAASPIQGNVAKNTEYITIFKRGNNA